MEVIIFEPDYAGLDKNIWFGLAFVIISVVTALFLRTRKNVQASYRGLGVILFGFIGVIALGVVVFSTWTINKITNVEITEDAFTSSYGTISIDAINLVYIKADQHPKGLFQVTSERTTHYLIVEAESSINHILSEVNYDIKRIKQELDKAISKSKSQNEDVDSEN